MPFVTKHGGLEMEFDTYPESKYYDPDARPEPITFQKECNMNPDSLEYKEIIRRGVPHVEQMYWKVDPCYRIPHNRFDTYTQERLLNYFLMERSEKLKNPNYLATIDYEPDIEDIEIRKYGHTAGWHMPLWMINTLVSEGVIEEAKGKGKIASSTGEIMITESEYTEFMTALKERKEVEANMEKTEDEELEEENIKTKLQSKKKANTAKESTVKREKNRRSVKRETNKQARIEKDAKLTDEKIRELVGNGDVS